MISLWGLFGVNMDHVLPKWFYHREHFPEGKIIRTKEEFDKMPKGFVESYGDLDKPIIEDSGDKIIEHAKEAMKEVVKPTKSKAEKGNK